MGKGLVEMLKKSRLEDEILAIGTNSIATAAMLKAGQMPVRRENPAVVTSRTADIIVGPMGIVIADSLMGEITPEDGRCDRPEPGKKGSDPGELPPAFCCGPQGRFDGRICKARGGGSAEDPARGAVNKR